MNKLGELLHSEVPLMSSLDRESYTNIFCSIGQNSCGLPDLSEGVIKIQYKGDTFKNIFKFQITKSAMSIQ